MDIIKFFKIWVHNMSLVIRREMAYKYAFFFIVAAIFLGDIIIPIISALIYTVSKGIPGWTLYEFVLFQGTLIIVMGIWHIFFVEMLNETISSVKDGIFDRILLRPLSSLALITSSSFDFDGIGELIAGITIVAWAMIKMHLFNWMILPYLGAIILAVIFEYSITVVAASLSFTFVKSWRLFELLNITERFTRYPITIFGSGLRFFLTFIVPAAIASYYPASILLGKEPLSKLFIIAIPVFIFFIFSLLLWKVSIKKYSSAGG